MSTLTELFGDGNNAYFSNGPITRLSFLRMQHKILDQASTHPTAKYLLFDQLNPLVDASTGKFAYLDYSTVQPLIGRPYEKDEKTQLADFDSSQSRPTLVFLGLNLDETASSAVQLGSYTGTPYFALDATHAAFAPLKTHQATLGRLHKPTRIDLTLSQSDSAILSQARSLLDWNARNTHCSACGSRTLSTHGGAKVVCPPTDAAAAATVNSTQPARRACPTRVGLHNQAFPRTDPTIIAAVLSADARRVLLGRGKRWPANYWSCLSGFLEPGESAEQATRREVYEEAGVRLGRVVVHSTQPWPYPSSLLIGTIGQCVDGEGEAVTYPEPELEEARWFGLKEVEAALDGGAGAMWEAPIKGWEGIRVPPGQLMAHQLLRGVVKLFGRR